MSRSKKIVFFHLLNDLSGSPNVLSQVIKGAVSDGFEVDLYTSNSNGFLSNIEHVSYKDIFYRLGSNRFFTLFLLLFSQFRLFFLLFKYKNQEVTFYVNTLLPFGAGLAGKILNKKVVYHIHETSITPQVWKKFLLAVVRFSATDIIYVSNYLKNKETIKKVSSKVIYNALPSVFNQVEPNRDSEKVIVLMACSLKKYKGVFQFIELAQLCPEHKFHLVLNADRSQINSFFENTEMPKNLTLFPKQKNLHPFYAESHVVINASIPDQWTETFGLTLIEAMAYGVPVIAPKIGGPAEIVHHGNNGFLCDSRNTQEMKMMLNRILSHYSFFSANALKDSKKYSESKFLKEINLVLG